MTATKDTIQYSKITVISFLRGDETLSNTFSDLCKNLSIHFSTRTIIITEENEVLENVNNFEYIKVKESTKYEKIRSILHMINSDYILCIDSDLTISIKNTTLMVLDGVENNIDLSWGKIRTKPTDGFIPKLVAIDKYLSHNYIRPILWKLNIGVSIPGQLFLFKVSTMKESLNFKDTFLDDLAIGMYARCNPSIKVKYNSDIVAYEEPSITTEQLFKQRKRWAIGYKSVLTSSLGTQYYKYILLHGLAYHLVFIANIIFFLSLFSFSMKISLLYLFFISFFLSNKNVSLYFYSFFYQLIFPVLHLYWLYYVLSSKSKT